MAQYSTPSADVVDGAWLDSAASATNLYLSIVPGTPGSIASGDDTTYIESEANPSSSAVGLKLSTIEDPASPSGHVLRWRRQKDAAGGGQIDLTITLNENYTDEGTQGTEIKSVADNDLSETPATATPITLADTEADSITDYSDLYIRFVANQST